MSSLPVAIRPNFAASDTKAGSNPVIESKDPLVLAEIGVRDVSLAIWQRKLPASFTTWLDNIPTDALPSGRWQARPEATWDTLTALFDACKTPDTPERIRLAIDIVDLVGRFAMLARTERVDVRLEAVAHDACWKFHRDSVPFRLLTTYRGPGSEWVPAGMADEALARQRRYNGPVRRVPRLAVAMFKGEMGETGHGVVHRSPPIAGSGVTRLLLCLDLPVDGPFELPA